MGTLELKLHKKQIEVYKCFLDPEITELLVGGGGSGGKTWGMCEIVTATCIAKPGIAWLVGRENLKKLKQSTWITFQKVRKNHGLKRDQHYHVNMVDFVVTFSNGSRIFFLDLAKRPSDLFYDRLGSLELTYAWIDEAQECERLVIDTIAGRFREKIKEYNLTGTIVLTCNPAKGHLYQDFIKPKREGTIKPFREFIQILYNDNPHLDQKKYETSLLNTGNKVQIQRLLYGNRDYDDNPYKLYDYDDLLNMETNPRHNDEHFIIGDPARLGEDLAVIMVFDGLEEIETVTYKKCKLDVYEQAVLKLQQKYKVNMKNVVIDADGLGGGVVDSLRCTPYHGGARPIQSPIEEADGYKPNYENLKTQCAFKLQDYINKIRINSKEIFSDLVEECDVMEERDGDKDGKTRIIRKEEIRQKILRSPNYFDCLCMRMLIELKPQTSFLGSGMF